jgi:hypothetical protein
MRALEIALILVPLPLIEFTGEVEIERIFFTSPTGEVNL